MLSSFNLKVKRNEEGQTLIEEAETAGDEASTSGGRPA